MSWKDAPIVDQGTAGWQTAPVLEPVRTEAGQFVPPETDVPALARDEMRWRDEIARAQAAGDKEGERQARQMLIATKQAQQPPAPVEPSPWQRFGSGAAQLPAGVAQLVPERFGGLSPEEERAFAEGRQIFEQAQPGFDPFSFAGEMIGQAPLALLPGAGPGGLAGRTLTGAAGEGAIGSLLFAESPEERARNIVGSAVGGGLGAGVGQGILSAGKAIGGAIPRGLPAEQAARRTAARRFGYDPTRGQLSRDPLEFGDEMNLAKQPGAEALQGRMQAQRAQDLANLEDLQARYGGPIEPEEAGAAIEQAAQGRARRWQVERVDPLYEAARAERPGATVPGERLATATAEVLDEVDLPNAVTRRISNLVGQEGGIAPQDLEKLDRLLTANQGVNKATDRAIGILKRNVRDVIDSAGEEYGGAYRAAVAEARQRFDALGEMKSVVNRLERGVLDPIKVIPTIKTAGIRELGALKSFIADEYPEAWQAMRGALATDIAQRSTPSGNFSQARYNNAINKIGRGRLRLLFGDEGAQDIMDFGGVVRDLYAVPRGSTVNVSNTNIAAQRSMDSMFRRVLGTVYLGGLYDVAAEAGARRANARAAAMALDPTKRTGLLAPRGAAAIGARTAGGLVGAGAGRRIAEELL